MWIVCFIIIVFAFFAIASVNKSFDERIDNLYYDIRKQMEEMDEEE